MILEIAGRAYKTLHITKFTPKVELLDGEGTGRSKADFWPMIRQPQGYIINFTLEFASMESKNTDFIHFWQTGLSLGANDFVPVRFVDPTETVIAQDMYYVIDAIDFRRVEDGGRIYTGPIKASFVARKGRR